MVYGGRDGVVDVGMIESAIARPYSGYHRRIERKAAALLEAVAKNHGFTDGNKRTAVFLVDLLIMESGYILDLAPGEDIDDIAVACVSNEMSHDDLVRWFRERLRR